MHPSELAHVFLDGGALDPPAEATLFEALAENGDLRSELRELLAIRAAVQSDVTAFTPPEEVTDRLFASLGISPSGFAEASTRGSAGWLRKLWIPLLAAVAATGITVYVITRHDAATSNGASSGATVNQEAAQKIPSAANAPVLAPSGVEISRTERTQTTQTTSDLNSSSPTISSPANSATTKNSAYASSSSASSTKGGTNQASMAGLSVPSAHESSTDAVEQHSAVHGQQHAMHPGAPQKLAPRVDHATTAAHSSPVGRADNNGSPDVRENKSGDALQQSVTGGAPQNSATASTSSVQPSVPSEKVSALSATPSIIAENIERKAAASDSQRVSVAPSTSARTTPSVASANQQHDTIPSAAATAPMALVGERPMDPLHDAKPSAMHTPSDYLVQMRAIVMRSSPSSTLATSNSSIPTNIVPGVFMLMGEHQMLGLEIGQESFGQQFSGRENDSAVSYSQNPLLMWGAAAYRLIASPVAFLGGGFPFAQVDAGATRLGPMARISLGLNYTVADRIDVMIGAEGSSLWYQFQSAWFTTRKFGATFGAALRF